MSPARKTAFAILLRVEQESAYAIELLHSALLDDLSPNDRNLAHEIVMGVLRWQSLLDSTFVNLLSLPFEKLDLEVLIALRMGAYQLAFLDRIPGHAIVDETVELIKKSRKRSAAPLVNAVMRKLEPRRPSLTSGGKGLAQDYSDAHPSWLVQRWIANFGRDAAQAICRYDQQIPSTCIRLGSPEDAERLRVEGIRVAPGALMKNARLVIGGDVTKNDLFRNGRIAIQDEGSQLIAALVGQGRRILDCCAAPGGKTAALAMALPETEILATELHPHRARLLRKMASQPNVHVLTADAQRLPFGADFDRILADVPCSGTGTLARNPEIKWRLKPEDLNDLQERQLAILNSALKHMAPGGRLVYSTCSLEPEEDEQVIAAVLDQNRGFEILPVHQELSRLQDAGILVWQDLGGMVSGNFLRTFPGVHPCDGFFAAIFQARYR